MNKIPVTQRVVAILWPSFITAGIATIIFTTAFDPEVIFIDYDISRMGVYTISFFLFWLFGSVAAITTCFFLKPCSAGNRSANNNQEKA